MYEEAAGGRNKMFEREHAHVHTLSNTRTLIIMHLNADTHTGMRWERMNH